MVKMSSGDFWVGAVGRDEVEGINLFPPQAKLVSWETLQPNLLLTAGSALRSGVSGLHSVGA